MRIIGVWDRPLVLGRKIEPRWYIAFFSTREVRVSRLVRPARDNGARSSIQCCPPHERLRYTCSDFMVTANTKSELTAFTGVSRRT